VVCASRDVAYMKKNAIITPLQQTPEHSQVLTPNSFQSILSTPRKFLAKARKMLSLKNRAVVLKTNLFSVKQPSSRDGKKSVARSSERKKGQNPLYRSLNKVGS
jgi:hypothetical protein